MRSLTQQKIRILLELSELKSIRKVAEVEHCSISAINSQKVDALMCIRNAAGQNTIVKNGAELIHCMAKDKYDEYYQELKSYIREGYSNEIQRKYWEQISCFDILTPEKLMDFLLAKFRLPIARKYKQRFDIGDIRLSQYNNLKLANSSFESFCAKYVFIYQVRLYSIFNKLSKKIDFNNLKDARQALDDTLKTSKEFYRGILRINNPFYEEWIILYSAVTDNLTYYDLAPPKWRYTYYGADDYIISEKILAQGWDFTSIAEQCRENNAYYVCISYWDENANEGLGDFLIDEFLWNNNFIIENLFIEDLLDIILQYRESNRNALYKQFLEKDEQETQSLYLK